VMKMRQGDESEFRVGVDGPGILGEGVVGHGGYL
jgi:hypothetical protein